MFSKHPFARPDLGLLAVLSIGGLLDDALAAARRSGRAAAPEISETPEAYTIKIELPGLSKDDVVIKYQRDLISVRAQKGLAAAEASAAASDTTTSDGAAKPAQERTRDLFAQDFHTGADLDIDAAQGKIEHGLLTITLPKREVPKPQRIQVI